MGSQSNCPEPDAVVKATYVAHWYRAQIITEEWRASAHRLLAELGDNEEVRLENRILGLLKTAGGSATIRDLYRALRSPRKPVIEALKALEQDGHVERFLAQGGERGRQPEAYRLTEQSVTVCDK